MPRKDLQALIDAGETIENMIFEVTEPIVFRSGTALHSCVITSSALPVLIIPKGTRNIDSSDITWIVGDNITAPFEAMYHVEDERTRKKLWRALYHTPKKAH